MYLARIGIILVPISISLTKEDRVAKVLASLFCSSSSLIISSYLFSSLGSKSLVRSMIENGANVFDIASSSLCPSTSCQILSAVHSPNDWILGLSFLSSCSICIVGFNPGGFTIEFRMVSRECKEGGICKGREVIFIRYSPYIGGIFPYIGGIFLFLVRIGDLSSLLVVNPLGF